MEIVYIEYCDGIPNQVVTCNVNDDYGLSTYDFEFIDGYRRDIRWYKSGGGGSKKKLQAPHFVDRRGKKYWMAESAKFKGLTRAINCKRIDAPLSIRGFYRRSINPFKISEEAAWHFEWCKVCKQHSDDVNGCSEHQHYDEENGMLIYNKDGSPVE